LDIRLVVSHCAPACTRLPVLYIRVKVSIPVSVSKTKNTSITDYIVDLFVFSSFLLFKQKYQRSVTPYLSS
jgi:hypothetical protein